MIYYNSRYLSQKLNINLAKWKRWVREFLPPDPLGGMQSGVTRQLNTKDAFKVYLGGYLVGTLKFTIPDALQILTDLTPWLEAHGFFQIHAHRPLEEARDMPSYRLFIYALPKRQFAYETRTLVSAEPLCGHDQLRREKLSPILTDKTPIDFDHFDPMCAFMIALTTLYINFLTLISSEGEQEG